MKQRQNLDGRPQIEDGSNLDQRCLGALEPAHNVFESGYPCASPRGMVAVQGLAVSGGDVGAASEGLKKRALDVKRQYGLVDEGDKTMGENSPWIVEEGFDNDESAVRDANGQ